MTTNTIRPIAIAIIRRGEEILVFKGRDKTRDHEYYRPLGGGLDFGEFAEDALKREFKEELNESLTNIEPVTILENIFFFEGEMKHELVFVFNASFADPDAYERSDLHIIDDDSVTVSWVPVADFKSHKHTLYPRGILGVL